MKDKDKKEKIDRLLDAVWKKALGYSAEEKIDELTVNDEGLNLNKQKITTKEVAPDITAIKLLLDELHLNEYENMTEEELEKEKIRLLKELKEKGEN